MSRPASLDPSTQMYVQLRAASARAGVPVTPSLTPEGLLEQLRETNSGAAKPAERIVDLYQRSRFGGESIGDSDVRTMREALASTRRILKAKP